MVYTGKCFLSGRFKVQCGARDEDSKTRPSLCAQEQEAQRF